MRLDQSFVDHWSDRYVNEELGSLERELLTTTHLAIAERGYLTADDLQKIGSWKAARVSGYLARNDEHAIADVTRVALAPPTPDWMRHRILRILDGVGHPMASAILTVWKPQDNTILDYRVVEALHELKDRGAIDIEPPWGRRGALPGYWTYLQVYRAIASSVNVRFRDLDRALWKWHKEQTPERWAGLT
jgi:hypothetical protein